ncbi:MAG: molybdenum cofactor biosynthesis protein MoaE [Chitinophagales bacterium]|nr:molybdenum cofactor biosynthesis protein MoaE [Chitinophagales bacterium]
MERTIIEILNRKLSLDECYSFIQNNKSGGNCIFIGSVRDRSQGKQVEELHFEAYKEMAVAEMSKISKEVLKMNEVQRIYIAHREGELQIGDIAVIIGVSSKHRDDAFIACRYIIDTLKETVPIWKKEIFTDGVSWVNAHP